MLTARCQILQLSAPAAMAISAEGKDAHGNPVRSYSKIILRAGVTVRNTGGNQVTITTDMLDRIAATFGDMKAGSIKVPIQLGHTDEADKTRGYVNDVWRDGNDLWATTEMIGTDGIMLASRSEVSVYVEPEREINGKKYQMALVHLACVPDPQVPGLGAFLPIAASLSGNVFRLAMDMGDGGDKAVYAVGDRVQVKPGREHNKMAMGAGTVKEIGTPALGIKFDGMAEVHHWYVAAEIEPAIKPIAASLSGQVFTVPSNQGTSAMNWKPLALVLSLDASKLTDETGPGAVEAAAKSLVDARNAAAAELSTLRAANDALKLSASAGAAPTVDAGILDEYANLTAQKFDALVADGKISPAQKDKFVSLCTGTAGARPALCLSVAAAKHAGLAAPIANEIISILSLSTGRKLGEKTGAQGRATDEDAVEAPGPDFAKLVDSYIPGAASKS